MTNTVSRKTLIRKLQAAPKPASTKAATGRFAPDDVVRVLVDNPKKPNCKGWHRWEAGYKDGRTVAETIAAGVLVADLNWDIARNFIRVEPAPKKAEA